MTDRATPELDRLLAAVDRFRGEGGCAWYEEQTHESLVRYLIEESAELVEAIEAGDASGMREELGDVLFQVLFHADVAAQHPDPAARFDLEDVAREQREKLERRNPHVFGETPTRDVEEIIRLWNEAKAIEKAQRRSVLDGIPDPMSSIARAAKVLARAEPLGVEPDPRGDAEGEERLGDELLALIARARREGADPDRALRDAVRRVEAAVRAAESGDAG